MPQFLKVSRVWLLSQGMVFDEVKAELMLSAFEHAVIEQTVDVANANRSIADPAFGSRHLNQRLEPIEAAAAGAHDLNVEPALFEFLAERGRDLFRADAERA
jgi:hypothetical protein